MTKQTNTQTKSTESIYQDQTSVYQSKDSIMLNTIRQIAYKYLPCHGFTPKNINISENTTIHNNDYLRLRISNLPCAGMDNSREMFESVLMDKYRQVIVGEKESLLETEDFDFGHIAEREARSEHFDDTGNDSQDRGTMSNVTMFCDVKFEESDVVSEAYKSITTDDCTYVVDGEPTPSPYTTPFLICKIRKGHSLRFSADSTYGVGNTDPIFVPFSCCWFRTKPDSDDDVWELFIENKSMEDNDEQLIRILRIMCLKTQAFRDLVERIVRNNNHLENIDTEGSFILPNDQFCMTNILIDCLQEHPDVEFAGYRIPHMLTTEAQVNYRLSNKKKSIVTVMPDVIKKVEDRCYLFIQENKLEQVLGMTKLNTSHLTGFTNTPATAAREAVR